MPILGFKVLARTKKGWQGPFREEYVWQKGINGAFCPHHTAPHPSCECGLYGYHDLNSTMRVIDEKNISSIAIVAVVGWGKVCVHSDRWRSQYSQVVAVLDFGLGKSASSYFSAPRLAAQDFSSYSLECGMTRYKHGISPSIPRPHVAVQMPPYATYLINLALLHCHVLISSPLPHPAHIVQSIALLPSRTHHLGYVTEMPEIKIDIENFLSNEERTYQEWIFDKLACIHHLVLEKYETKRINDYLQVLPYLDSSIAPIRATSVKNSLGRLRLLALASHSPLKEIDSLIEPIDLLLHFDKDSRLIEMAWFDGRIHTLYLRKKEQEIVYPYPFSLAQYMRDHSFSFSSREWLYEAFKKGAKREN